MSRRLNLALAEAGVASRRAADRLIAAGRVSVNGRVVSTLGLRVDPQRDVIAVDGRRVPRPPRSHVYLMLNKPRGVVTTLADPEGRPTILELLGETRRRVYPVGRLDYHSEGLLLLTDDGPLCRDLTHPRNGVPRTYAVKVRGLPSDKALERLRSGVSIDGRRARAEVRRPRAAAQGWLEVTVREGRKHQVRRMLEAVGHPVLRLRRIRYGGVALGRLPKGRLRRLTSEEVDRLRQAVGPGVGNR